MRNWTRLVAAAAMVLAAAASARADTFTNILTGGTSGVCYPLGIAPAPAR